VIICLVLLAIYGVIWIKVKVKRPLFKPMPVEEILAVQAAAEEEQRKHLEAIIAKKAGGSGKGGTA